MNDEPKNTSSDDELPEVTDNLTSGETEPQENASAGSQNDEVAQLKDKYLRLYADFENFRRRTAKEKIELIGAANEKLLLALLPVVDDFERALPVLESSTDVAAMHEGIALIYHKLLKTLEGQGLKPMTSKGEAFDADLHESVAQFPAPSDELKGKVIDEMEKGYTLNDKVIRFAKVIVGS